MNFVRRLGVQHSCPLPRPDECRRPQNLFRGRGMGVTTYLSTVSASPAADEYNAVSMVDTELSVTHWLECSGEVREKLLARTRPRRFKRLWAPENDQD